MVADEERVTVRRNDLDMVATACAKLLPTDVEEEVLDALERIVHDVGGTPATPEPDLPPGGEWAIVELLGHRERRGYVTQIERFGVPLLHIDLAAKLWGGDAGAWEEYAGAALYGMHPTTPGEVRAVWEREQERERRQRAWAEQERTRWVALPAGQGDPDNSGGEDEDLDDEDDRSF